MKSGVRYAQVIVNPRLVVTFFPDSAFRRHIILSNFSPLRGLTIMPEADTVQSSWADEIEEVDESTLPPPMEKIQGDYKIVTSYKFNEDGKKVKVTR